MNQQSNNKTDAELFSLFIEGDEGAFEQIMIRYKRALYGFLKRFLNRDVLVQDVFQETFIQLYNSRESYDPGRPLRPWLYTIAANKAKDALRKQQRNATVTIGTMAEPEESSFNDVLNSLTSYDTTPYDNLDREETAARVREVISNMPENLREILIFAYFNKFSYKQMAQILGIPIGTVKSRLHTAVGYFAKAWKSVMRSKETK